MEAFTAEDLSKIGGIATVSLLHSFIPTHWLPFSIVGRAQKWTLSRTLFVSEFTIIFPFLSLIVMFFLGQRMRPFLHSIGSGKLILILDFIMKSGRLLVFFFFALCLAYRKIEERIRIYKAYKICTVVVFVLAVWKFVFFFSWILPW